MELRTLESFAIELVKDIIEYAEKSEFKSQLQKLPTLKSYGAGSYDEEADAFTIEVFCENPETYEHSEWVSLPKGSALVDFDGKYQVLGIQVLNGKKYYKLISRRSA